MSRIGKQIVIIPEKTEVIKDDSTLTVKGPLGVIKREFRYGVVDVLINGNEITFMPKEESSLSKSLWGTYASHVKNMIDGVNKAYEKKLKVEGVGFKSEVKGGELVLALGFSHSVEVKIPDGLTVTAEKNVITITGIDKEIVGQFAAKVRALKKPEPYKGKGIRYDDEIVRRKQGKKSV